MALTKEQIAGQIAIQELTSGSHDSLLDKQKGIADGKIVQGRDSGSRMVMYRSDRLVHPEDESIYTQGNLTSGYEAYSASLSSPENVSQFVEFTSGSETIDPSAAKDILDTTVYELLPQRMTRQQRINRFFQDYLALRAPSPPDFYEDPVDSGFYTSSDINAAGGYNELYNISVAGSFFGSDTSNTYITRLSAEEDSVNFNQSLQWLRDDLNAYLLDVDSTVNVNTDSLDDYTDTSPGYSSFSGYNNMLLINAQVSGSSPFSDTTDVADTFFDDNV